MHAFGAAAHMHACLPDTLAEIAPERTAVRRWRVRAHTPERTAAHMPHNNTSGTAAAAQPPARNERYSKQRLLYGCQAGLDDMGTAWSEQWKTWRALTRWCSMRGLLWLLFMRTGARLGQAEASLLSRSLDVFAVLPREYMPMLMCMHGVVIQRFSENAR